MKKLLIFAAFYSCIGLHKVQAQDISITIVAQENGVNDGVWSLNPLSTTSTLLVTVCNNDFIVTVPAFKVRPLISVPSAICQIAPSGLQSGLPANWTILSNTGGNIRLCNNIDTWGPGECREFTINVIPTTPGTGLAGTNINSWANGVSCNVSGAPPQPPFADNPFNNTSETGITVVQNTILPINLMSFTGTVNQCQTTLHWKVSDDSNSEYFEIEQSTDGRGFNKAGEVFAASGRVDYQFRSAHPGGPVYYRLKMMDQDGKVTYSPVVKVTSGCGGNDSFRVYPNPAQVSSSFRIEFGRSGKYDVQLINAVGVVLNRRQVNAMAGQVVEENCNRYAPGNYFLKIINTITGEEGRHKLLIQ